MTDYTKFGFSQAQREFAEGLLLENFRLYREAWEEAENYEEYARAYVIAEYDATASEWESLTLESALEIAAVVAADLKINQSDEVRNQF